MGVAEGLKRPSCVNLCNLFTVRQQDLKVFVGTVSARKMLEVRRALAVAMGCS